MSEQLTAGQRLAREAAEAAELRTWQTHPDVIALHVEKIRTRVDRMMWAGIVMGLCFTMVNVQRFAAQGAATWSLQWLSAWLLDPTVAIILLAILIAERRIAPGQIQLGVRSQVAKWILLLSTYVMNTWESWATGSLSGVVLHSVPPLAVFLAAESITDCHDKLTEFVYWAHARAKKTEAPTTAPEVSTCVDTSPQGLTAVPPAPVVSIPTPRVTTSHEWPSKASSGNGADSRTETPVVGPGVTWSVKTNSQASASHEQQAAPPDDTSVPPVTEPVALDDSDNDQVTAAMTGGDSDNGLSTRGDKRVTADEVLSLIDNGLSIDDIAVQLGVSTRTVRRRLSASRNGHPVSA